MYRVVLIDDENIIVEGLRRVIKWADYGCEVVGTASGAEEGAALIEGASPVGLNSLEQSAAETNAQLTRVSLAVQDAISAEAKSTLFTNIQKVVTGQMTAEKAVALAIQRNE